LLSILFKRLSERQKPGFGWITRAVYAVQEKRVFIGDNCGTTEHFKCVIEVQYVVCPGKIDFAVDEKGALRTFSTDCWAW
jgi:hypothetical protein